MGKTIDDMLSDEPLPETAEVETPEVETEAEPETDIQPRDEHGRFASKQEAGVENIEAEAPEPVPPTEQTNQLPPAEYAALKDERRKRQELEAQVAAMQAQFATSGRAIIDQQRQAEPTVDFWDDPNAFLTNMQKGMRQEILQALREEQTVERLNASEAAAIGKYADYPEKFAAFQQAVHLNPRLAQELAQASDPGEFAYSRGKTALEIERHGSIDALLASERAKWENEVRAAAPRPVLPSTTAADGSVGSRSGPEWSGITPLGDILR